MCRLGGEIIILKQRKVENAENLVPRIISQSETPSINIVNSVVLI